MNHAAVAEDRSRARRRRWADVAVIFAAVYLFLAAVWAPPELISGGEADSVQNTSWLYYAYGLGGTLGIAGIIVAIWHTTLARLMVGAGALLTLSAFLALNQLTALAALSIGVSGLVMLVAAPFVGPMPSPEEEGRPRSGLGT